MAEAAQRQWEQLDEMALRLLRQGVARLGSIKAVAEKIGYSRSAVSTALAGKYIGGTRKMRTAIMEHLTGIMLCPYLEEELTADECRIFRERRCPTSSRAEVKHWQACQLCRFNPAALQEAGRGSGRSRDANQETEQ